jgi:hypothetical protein
VHCLSDDIHRPRPSAKQRLRSAASHRSTARGRPQDFLAQFILAAPVSVMWRYASGSSGSYRGGSLEGLCSLTPPLYAMSSCGLRRRLRRHRPLCASRHVRGVRSPGGLNRAVSLHSPPTSGLLVEEPPRRRQGCSTHHPLDINQAPARGSEPGDNGTHGPRCARDTTAEGQQRSTGSLASSPQSALAASGTGHVDLPTINSAGHEHDVWAPAWASLLRFYLGVSLETHTACLGPLVQQVSLVAVLEAAPIRSEPYVFTPLERGSLSLVRES